MDIEWATVEKRQRLALAIGMKYVREPDDHYVESTLEQVLDFVRDAIGVDVHIVEPKQ